MIISLSNPRVRFVKELNDKAKTRKKEGLFTAEGLKMFLEAPPERIRMVYLTEEMLKEPAAAQKLSEQALPYETVSDPVFRKMSDTMTPQGVLTVLGIPDDSAEEIIRGSFGTGPGDRSSPAPLFAVLENLQDPGNVGTILRTGEGAGVSGVLMTEGCADLYSPKTVRATMGSVYRVRTAVCRDITEITELLRKYNITTYAAHLDGRKEYDQCDYLSPSAFLIGNEGNGLTPEAASCADCLIRIPMLGKVESLNAAMASGILLYEAARQRRSLLQHEV